MWLIGYAAWAPQHRGAGERTEDRSLQSADPTRKACHRLENTLDRVHRIFGQRRNDDCGLGSLLDGSARYAPAVEPFGMRVDRMPHFRGTGVKVMHEDWLKAGA